jgi:mannose-6-phosphate isomerase-like protein (cupin superfamily)
LVHNSGQSEHKKDNDELYMNAGTSVDIPKECWHRIENCCEEDLVIIEIQQGDHCSEHDIERLEDDYGRT